MRIDTQRLRTALDAQDVTKSQLARISGVSRTAIHGILRDADKQVRPETIRRLAASLNISPDFLTLGGIPAAYREWLVGQHDRLNFQQPGLGRIESTSLAEVYVPTEILPDDAAEPDPRRGSAATRPNNPARPLPERLEFAEAVLRHDRIVLVGAPGSGKTTLLRRLAAETAAAARTATSSGDSVTPVFVRLAEYAKAYEHDERLDPVALVAAHARQDGCPDPERFLRDELDRGKCVVLLDGLDEVAGHHIGQRLTRLLAQFMARYPANQYVVTTRRIGLDWRPWEKLGFTRLGVAPWREEQIRRFVRQWYRTRAAATTARARDDADAMAQTLCNAILSNRRLRAIAGSPLMLTILATLHQDLSVLPRRRAELVGKIADTFLQTWEAAKCDARPGDTLHGTVLEGREYGWLLAHLALQMQIGGVTVVPHWWLADQTGGFLHEMLGLELSTAKSECDRVIRHLGRRTGLFVECGQGFYAFWHVTFQEYFAAQAIVHQIAGRPGDGPPGDGPVELLRPYLYHPRFSEVVRLVASQLAPTQTPGLLQAILDDSDPVGRFLHRGPLLALGCLADGAVAADARVVERVFSGVVEAGKSGWMGITLDALRLLHEFDGTRLATNAQAALGAIFQAAEQKLPTADLFRLRQVGDARFRRQVEQALANPGRQHPELGTTVTVECGDGRAAYYFLDPRLKAADPRQWYARAEALLHADNTEEGLRTALVVAIASAVLTSPRAGEILLAALRTSRSDRVRERCAEALGQLADRVGEARAGEFHAALVDAFGNDSSPEVRRCCGAGLSRVAVQDAMVRETLLATLCCAGPHGARAGAAAGLKRVAATEPDVRNALLRAVASPQENEVVRIFCLGSLEPCLGEDRTVLELFVRLLDATATAALQEVASEVLAKALTRAVIPWDQAIVEQVERNLMTVAHPRAHHLAALRELATPR
ncbi:MAG: NACHT domain-containing protein [Candidatus Nealsonbacteria bacterium]|nr:NACHT domain-containing protein [Candidatus Nealsonbacteria bacterium]